MVFDCEHRRNGSEFRLGANDRGQRKPAPSSMRKLTIADLENLVRPTPATTFENDFAHFNALRSLNERLRKFWGKQ